MVPTVVADKMCHGKVLIEPQTYPIGSIENKPTNNDFPSSLYSTVFIAVLCSSDKDEAVVDDQEEPHLDVDLDEREIPLEHIADALISLGLASLFLDSSTTDFVRTVTVVVHYY